MPSEPHPTKGDNQPTSLPNSIINSWFVSSGRLTLRPLGRYVYTILTEPSQTYTLLSILLVFELVIGSLIIFKVKYTEIDWKAYMQEVEGVLIDKNYDYAFLRGDTGPLVYPAGFVYIYSFLYYLTDKGSNILRAQFIFLGLYLASIAVVGAIYKQLKAPPRLLLLLSLSKRIHSIFMLRLFNDPVAMLLVYVSFYFLLKRQFFSFSLFYSLALSVKMNILLFLPGVLLTLYIAKGGLLTILHVLFILVIQFALGLPFLMVSWRNYLKGAFDLGRQFDYKWTVNWRMFSQATFNSRGFSTSLLLLHVSLLVLFLISCWARPHGGIVKLISGGLGNLGCSPASTLSNSQIASYLMVSNLIGLTFSRSLHYQFYSWYFHTIPFLLDRLGTCYPLWLRFILFFSIEYAWNVYPSTPFSSTMLLASHIALIAGLWVIDFSLDFAPPKHLKME